MSPRPTNTLGKVSRVPKTSSSAGTSGYRPDVRWWRSRVAAIVTQTRVAAVDLALALFHRLTGPRAYASLVGSLAAPRGTRLLHAPHDTLTHARVVRSRVPPHGVRRDARDPDPAARHHRRLSRAALRPARARRVRPDVEDGGGARPDPRVAAPGPGRQRADLRRDVRRARPHGRADRRARVQLPVRGTRI